MRNLSILLLSSTVALAPLAAQTTTAPAATPATPPAAAAATAPTAAPASAPAATPAPATTPTTPATTPAAPAASTPATTPAPQAAAAPATGAAPAGAAAAAPTAVAAGQAVVDTSGAAVGNIEAVTNGVATLATGTVKVGVPVSSFAMGPKGPVIGMTKAEIESKAGAATAGLNIAVGATVNDASGAKIGTVKAVNGDMVTVASATASAQVPKASFAAGQGGALALGMTAAQFDAQAKAAGGSAAAAPAKKG